MTKWISLMRYPRTVNNIEWKTHEGVALYGQREMNLEKRLHTKTNDTACKIVSWGANSYGQLGQGHKDDQLEPNIVTDVPQDVHIKHITGGGGHTLAITEKNELLVCGSNSKGELGVDDIDNITILTPLPILQNQCITKAVGGWQFTLAINDDGCLYSWGSNSFSQLGRRCTTQFTSSPSIINQFDKSNKVKDIAAGLRHSVALTDNGCVYTWGHGKKGQLGVILSEKTVPRTSLQPTKVDIPENISQIFCGSFHSGALTECGNIYIWGCNKYGQLCRDLSQKYSEKPVLIPSDTFNGRIIQVNSGWTHILALTDKGTVYSWGRGDYGQLGRKCVGNCDNKPYIIDTLNQVEDLACGSEHNLAVTGSGELLSWGWNEHGICGNGDEENVFIPSIPKQLASTKVRYIGCGAGHSFSVIM